MAGKQVVNMQIGPHQLNLYRFTNHALSYEDQMTNLTALMQGYLSTMVDLGADTWIMHGTLLGWWWNQKVGFHISGSLTPF